MAARALLAKCVEKASRVERPIRGDAAIPRASPKGYGECPFRRRSVRKFP